MITDLQIAMIWDDNEDIKEFQHRSNATNRRESQYFALTLAVGISGDDRPRTVFQDVGEIYTLAQIQQN